MRLLRKYETPFEGILNNWLNDEFIGIPSIDHSIKTLPSVNLIESKESYTIELSAPGFDKDDFKIELDNFNLSVSLDIDDKLNESIIDDIPKFKNKGIELTHDDVMDVS